MLMRIGGAGVPAGDDGWIDVRNPATGELVDRVPRGSPDDVARAVEAAENAAAGWAKKTPRERGIVLFHAAGRVREEHRELARLLTTEQGKPLRESLDEVRGFANILEFYAGISAAQHGELIRLGAAGDALVAREPLGVCGAIIPWNMPVLIAGWKTGPALLAGNTLVIKPASTAPLTVLRLGEILEAAGLPPGTLNIVTGPGEVTGEALARHPGIRKLSFTGNSVTGRRIRTLALGHGAELTLELGGSDAMIVLEDAALDKAVEGAIRGRFYNAGQTCTAVKRLFVQESVAARFVEKLLQRIGELKIGNGLADGVDMGPLNNPGQRERIGRAVETVKERGEGTVLAGGSVPEGEAYNKGLFYSPTLVTGVPPECPLLTEEIFGPVLPVVPVPDLETGIRGANRTRYGLGASVWTRDLHAAKRAFDELQAGIVWVNRHLTVPPEVPFGGVSESGIGRENGLRALDGYTRTKTLFLGW